MGERVATWQRVSSDGQDTDNQTATLDRHCHSSGHEIVKKFVLPDTSAFKGKHQLALDEILADVKAGEYTRVIAVTSSRFERRGVAVGLQFILDLKERGGRLEAADNPLFGDTSNLGGWIVSVASGSADNEYSQKISDNVNRAFRRMDDSGSFRGCPPVGYLAEGEKYGKRLIPDPQRAEDIRTAFQDAITGTGTTELGKRLGMTPDAIAKMLRNEIYSKGQYQIVSHRGCDADADCRANGARDGKSRCLTVVHRCAPLVHPAVQTAAIAALEGRRTGDNVSSRALRAGKDDLSGALYCPCGHRVGLHRYYGGGKKRKDGTASTRVRRYRCQGCGRSVRADQADQAVEALMSSRAVPWLDRWLIPGDDHSAELDRVKLELRELSARGLDDDEEDRERDRLRAERTRLGALDSIPARTVTGFRRDAAGNILTEADKWASLDNAGRRAWLASGEFRILVSAEPGRTGGVVATLDSDG